MLGSSKCRKMIGTSDCPEISFSRIQPLQIPKYSHGPRELDTSQRIPKRCVGLRRLGSLCCLPRTDPDDILKVPDSAFENWEVSPRTRWRVRVKVKVKAPRKPQTRVKSVRNLSTHENKSGRSGGRVQDQKILNSKKLRWRWLRFKRQSSTFCLSKARDDNS